MLAVVRGRSNQQVATNAGVRQGLAFFQRHKSTYCNAQQWSFPRHFGYAIKGLFFFYCYCLPYFSFFFFICFFFFIFLLSVSSFILECGRTLEKTTKDSELSKRLRVLNERKTEQNQIKSRLQERWQPCNILSFCKRKCFSLILSKRKKSKHAGCHIYTKSFKQIIPWTDIHIHHTSKLIFYVLFLSGDVFGKVPGLTYYPIYQI